MKHRKLAPKQQQSLEDEIGKRKTSARRCQAWKNFVRSGVLSFAFYWSPVSWLVGTGHYVLWCLVFSVEYALFVVACFLAVGYLLSYFWNSLPRLKKSATGGVTAPASAASPATTLLPTTPSPHHASSSSPHRYSGSPLQYGTPQLHSPYHSLNASLAAKSYYQSTPVSNSSPFSGSECLSDLRSLESYLKSEEKQYYRASTSGNWSGGPATMDITPVLNGSYHIATRSPGFKDDSSSAALDSNWLGVAEEDLDVWVDRCRKWISRTILAPLIKEIDTINETLFRIGITDFKIGTASMSVLRQLVVGKMEHLPTLGLVMPYLDITSKQDYLVHRLSELAMGNSLAAFQWKSGGTWTKRPWDQDLPTDSQVVMHLLCSYMDAHLPPSPQHPNGQVFSSQHFLRCPYKPKDKTTDICIYQSSNHPPHYQVILNDTTVDIPKGRNNLFYAIIFFLHHIQTKRNGMLGQINLGLSGINILWIISKK